MGKVGYRRQSTVTETEDVSYVSSAYVPQCLRHGGRPTLSNAHRAHECATSDSNIRDELDEVITLNSVSVIVSEFVPFGANQIVQLNHNLGSTERVQGGFYTALIDEDAAGTRFTVEPGLTSVNILDYTLTNHINFEADIHFPEPPGVVQVEMFGCSINANGTCFYGLQVEAVMERIKDNISLDHLSRLLVDVHIDSSKIIDSVISGYQRSLMNVIFMGDAENRDKVNLIIANEITPHLTAEEYMDKGEYENELKQVLGDTHAAFDISEHDSLIFGDFGLLVAGPNARHHEPLLCSYLQFVSMEIYIRNFFNRMFIVADQMKQIRKKIDTSHEDPDAVYKIRRKLASVQQDLIFLSEILGYVDEALDGSVVPPEPPEQAGRSLYERLQIHERKRALRTRVDDLKKNMEGAWHEQGVLREMSAMVTDDKVEVLQQHIVTNTASLVRLHKHNERSMCALEIMQILFAGMLAFDFLDRITGDWSVVNQEWLRSFVEPIMKNTPAGWFLFSMGFWVAFSLIVVFLMKWMRYRGNGTIIIRLNMKRQINVKKLNRFLQERDLASERRDFDVKNDVIHVSWQEKKKREWGGNAPSIEISYDERSSFLLGVILSYNRRQAKKSLAFSAKELRERIIEMLTKAGVFPKEIAASDRKAVDSVTFPMNSK